MCAEAIAELERVSDLAGGNPQVEPHPWVAVALE